MGYFGLGGGGPVDVGGFGAGGVASSLAQKAAKGIVMTPGEYGQYLAQSPTPPGFPAAPSYNDYIANMAQLGAAVQSGGFFAPAQDIGRGTPGKSAA